MRIDSLNPSQREAVTHGNGPLLILAGAGSGKTRVLVSRIAHLVLERGANPSGILAVTFTNKAAGEMRERLHALIGKRAESLWLGTFHSLGLRILRREGRAGLTVYNDDDQLSLVKLVMKELDLPEKSFQPRALLSAIDGAKNELIGPDEYLGYSKGFFSERVARVYGLYQKKLKEAKALDFGDLLMETVLLFRKNPHILDSYRRMITHILVDEYQDTNRAQYAFMNLLAEGSGNICVVGDPDQSIYTWRGADIRNILEFERDWPQAVVIKLEDNYRSTRNILGAASSVIEKNKRRIEKTLRTDRHEGEPVLYHEAVDEFDEARFVIGNIRDILDKKPGSAYRDFAVFYRTNAQSRVFEEFFIREGMPYAIVGGTRFYDRKEIRDALAYLKLAQNPSDEVSFLRAINTPARGMGAVSVEKVCALSKERGVSLVDALRDALDSAFSRKTGARDFVLAVDAFKKGMKDGLPLHEAAQRLLEDSGYMDMLMKEGTEEAFERMDNLRELATAIKEFRPSAGEAALSDFLDHVALITDLDSHDDDRNRVTLMTMHNAKGLEFPCVFMAGMEEGLFPHNRSLDSTGELEEERRLCYVGMTRAMERLFLVSAMKRTLFAVERIQTRSRFIGEVSPGFIEKTPASSSRADMGRYFTIKDTHAEGQEPVYTVLDDAESAWRRGMQVRHPMFGLGIVIATEGAGMDAKLTVRFSGHGTKKLAVRYAGLMPA